MAEKDLKPMMRQGVPTEPRRNLQSETGMSNAPEQVAPISNLATHEFDGDSQKRIDEWMRRLNEMSAVEPSGPEQAIALLVRLEELVHRPVHTGPPPRRRRKAAKRAN